jgi:hypothetical protein
MSTTFPTTLDVFVNPSAVNNLNSAGVVHHVQHDNLNDSVAALEAKLGVDNSAVATSLDLLIRSAGYNYLINGGMDLFQRQTPGTLTTIAADKYGPDRWRVCQENASVLVGRTDTLGAAESGLVARYYAVIQKGVSTGKMLACQPVEGVNTQPLQSRTVTLQCKLKIPSGTATLRLGIFYLTSSGTIDTIPASIVSAWNANSTDPTLGTNLSYQAVAAIPAGAQGSISGNAVSCAITTAWQVFAGTFVLPSNCKNILLAIWTDSQFAVNNNFDISEICLYDGAELRTWMPRLSATEIHLAQRFFEKSYEIDLIPGTTWTIGSFHHPMLLMSGSPVGTAGYAITYVARKRALPTITLYDSAGTSGKIDFFNGAVWAAGGVPGFGGTDHAVFAQTTGASAIQYAYTAESEL